MSRIDAAKDAAKCLRKLAREQDAAATRVHPGNGIATICAAALATTRGEAVVALGHLRNALDCGTAEEATAHEHLDTLANGNDAIPSATLTTWADGWEAYASREAAAADEPVTP